MNLLERLARVKLLVFDMDGVLTNGKILVMPDGQWVRQMDIKDGYAIQLAIRSGLEIAIITGSHDEGIEKRLLKLGVNRFYQKVAAKAIVLSELIASLGLTQEEVLYMGDDVPDLEAFELAGIRVCPNDAAADLLEVADYISPFAGGLGCVRDTLEKVLRIKGLWYHKTGIQSI
jgi:3-deoxy-D-manno-octulosonate 8-phosphate phosphatase (KDO 8-P phosphatase)